MIDIDRGPKLLTDHDKVDAKTNVNFHMRPRHLVNYLYSDPGAITSQRQVTPPRQLLLGRS